MLYLSLLLFIFQYYMTWYQLYLMLPILLKSHHCTQKTPRKSAPYVPSESNIPNLSTFFLGDFCFGSYMLILYCLSLITFNSTTWYQVYHLWPLWPQWHKYHQITSSTCLFHAPSEIIMTNSSIFQVLFVL